MRIKLLSIYCGPSGTHQINEEIDREADEALALIKGGYAVAVAVPEDARAEHAVAEPAEARAEPVPSKRRGR